MGVFDAINNMLGGETAEERRAREEREQKQELAKQIRERAAVQRQRNAEGQAKHFAPQAMAATVPLPAQQAQILQGAIEDVTDAIGKENDSRVSQLREMRRMEHEKELEAMRTSALIERVRIAKEADDRAKSSPFGGLILDLTGTARQIS